MANERDIPGPLFSTRSSITNARLSVHLAGCLDMETAPLLREFLNHLTDDLTAGIVRDFEFDTMQLYLMSSTSISHFASWIKHVKDLFPESRVRFRTNPNLVWQQRTLAPLRRLADKVVSID